MCFSEIGKHSGKIKGYPYRLLAGRKLLLKWTGSVLQKHFQEMNLVPEEEGNSTADIPI